MEPKRDKQDEARQTRRIAVAGSMLSAVWQAGCKASEPKPIEESIKESIAPHCSRSSMSVPQIIVVVGVAAAAMVAVGAAAAATVVA